jgi:multidrug efflux pump subunit AcrA (membrane-fusion protein)
MATLISPLPLCRTDLVIRVSGKDGSHVIKNPQSGEYFSLGPQESFMLARLDGRHTPEQICAEFEKRFGEPLSAEELEGFLELARESKLVREAAAGGNGRPATAARTAATPARSPTRARSNSAAGARPSIPRSANVDVPIPAPRNAPQTIPAPSLGEGDPIPSSPAAASSTAASSTEAPAKSRQSILYWRKSFFDPDRLFNWLEPKIRFIWTRAFMVISSVAAVAAFAVVWANRHELLVPFTRAWGWETLLLAWLALATTTTLHEFAHGLTCKHWGGQVHEVGFLLLFFTPCFYCNVSDTWLIREKSRRLLVTFAGAWCDVVVWSAAAFTWRLTAPDTWVNYLAWVIMSIVTARIFFNFNPLLKLDGYYLLSDAVEIPNLRQRAIDRAAATVRWLLWGAPRPGGEARGRFLAIFGFSAWLYSLVFLSIMLFALLRYANGRWGAAGAVCVVSLSIIVMRGLMRGTTVGELGRMVMTRRARAAVWGLLLVALVSASCFVTVAREARGSFHVRPAVRSLVPAPAAGFLADVCVEEGSRVEAGAVIARLEIPDLSSRIAQKRAEVIELESTIAFARAEVENAGAEVLADSSAEYRAAQKSRRAFAAQLEQSTAKLAGAKEDLAWLEKLAQRSTIRSPIAGTVVTPRVSERKGQYLKEGEEVCAIESAGPPQAEVQLPEDEAAPVRPGQTVELKARALPFENFTGVVLGRAAAATPGDVRGTVTVYCQLENAPAELVSGMGGWARVQCGRQPVGVGAVRKVLKFLRTEFWW